MDNISERLLNPGLMVTMAASGLAYGMLLWSLNIRPLLRLWAAAVLPGVIFIIVVWSTRAAQGTPSLVYAALFVDWLIFAHAGFFAVLGARRWRRR